MVEIAIPLLGGLAVVLLRAAKNKIEKKKVSGELKKELTADLSAGAAITFGANSLLISLFKIQLFMFNESDVNLLLTIAGIYLILEGGSRVRQIIKNGSMAA
ncbi:hypothetical protein HZC09_04590 [Candidatus Micrarchaeota archaeon]|nr:hypothetical protein [Candidatus Micrarchaeota archaeon]